MQLRRNISDVESTKTLKFIESWCQHKEKQDSLLLLDIDSTLIDTSYRTSNIFREFARESDHKINYKELCHKISSWPQDLYEVYDPIDFLKEHTRLSINTEQASYLNQYWKARFFEPIWFEEDQAFMNASAFIQTLEPYVNIGYLTGRCDSPLRETTQKQLKKYNFPLRHPDLLLMKSAKDIPDLLFKDQGLQHSKEKFKNILYIENEVELINMSIEKHPDIETVLFDSIHSGRDTLQTSPLKLRSWKL